MGAINVFVEAGAQVDSWHRLLHRTSLHEAVEPNNSDAALTLLRLNPNVDVEDLQGTRPLGLACLNLAVGSTNILLRSECGREQRRYPR